MASQPTPEEQKKTYKELFDRGSENVSLANNEDKFFVVSLQWYNRWRDHVDLKESGKQADSPGPIDNSDIVVCKPNQKMSRVNRLRNPSGLDVEFDVVSKDLWETLLSWYSLAPGSPILRRPIMNSMVEISAPVFDVWEVNQGTQNKVTMTNVQIVASRDHAVMFTLLHAIQELVQSRGLTEPSDDWEPRTRFWFSLEQDTPQISGPAAAGGGEAESKTETTTGSEESEHTKKTDYSQWHHLSLSNTDRKVFDLQIGDTNVTMVRAPRILIETKASENSDWILPTPAETITAPEKPCTSVDVSPAAELSEPTNQKQTQKKEADNLVAEATKARKEAREGVMKMSDDMWRKSLAKDMELDCFDGKAWRESQLIAVGREACAGLAAAKETEELPEDCIAVHFRNEGTDHVLMTQSSAGKELTKVSDDKKKETKPSEGAIAKPYTYVSDWRTQLRQDMQIEVMGDTQHNYRCEEAGTTLHFVSSNDEWWVSDHTGAESHKRHGYLNVKGKKECPPLSAETEWELWVATGGHVWLNSKGVHVTLEEGSAGKKDVRIHTDENEIESLHPGFSGNRVKITGLFKYQSSATWEKSKVVKVDYKSRKVTVAQSRYSSSRYSMYSTTYNYYQPVTKVISLDSNDIREVSFLGAGSTGSDVDPDDIRERLSTGLAGLRNIGNTCYMNSVLQCMFANLSFSHFFADKKRVEASINKKNFLGTGGKLAQAFTALVHKVAMQTGDIVEGNGPLSAFKYTLGNFAPNFANSLQQDAMEFYNQFTSLIHEDLNRIIEKPYIEDLDDDGKMSDSFMADESWSNYKKRNDSLMVDLFQGQFRSHLTCPREECGYESRRFDPFSAIACPLPKAPKKIKHTTVRFYSLAALNPDAPKVPACDSAVAKKNNMKPMPLTFTAKLQCQLKGSAVAEEVSTMTGLPIEQLLVLEAYNGKFFRLIFHAASKTDVTFMVRDYVVVYEVPEGFDTKSQVMLEVRFLHKEVETPVLIPVNRTEVTTRSDISNTMRKFMNARTITSTEQLENDAISLPKLETDDIVCWTENDIEQKGVIEYIRSGYGAAPTKLRIRMDTPSGQSIIEKDIKEVAHTKDFKALAKARLETDSTHENDEVVSPIYQLTFIDAETMSYNIVPPECPWKKPSTTMIHTSLEEQPSKCCPTISCVIVNWDRDLALLADPDFDNSLVSPPIWSNESNESNNKESTKEEVLSLHNSLRKYMRREQLGANDEWYCRGCKQHVRAFKKMDIWRLPPLIVFHLKRFSYEVGHYSTHREKLEGNVEFPFEIDMSEYVFEHYNSDDSAQKSSGSVSQTAAGSKGQKKEDAVPQRLIYELVGISNHMGGLGGGHYTAYTKRGNQWYLCNDSSIVAVNRESVRTPKAYVLFYKKVDVSADAQRGADELESKNSN